jgi:hypothetical protein
MTLQFPKQYKAAGLQMPLLGGGTSADEFALPFMEDEAIGYVTALQYSAAIKTEKNRAFVEAPNPSASTSSRSTVLDCPTSPPRTSRCIG